VTDTYFFEIGGQSRNRRKLGGQGERKLYTIITNANVAKVGHRKHLPRFERDGSYQEPRPN